MYIKTKKPSWTYESEREFQEKHPYSKIGWRFSAKRYVERKRMEKEMENEDLMGINLDNHYNFHLSEKEWGKIFDNDKKIFTEESSYEINEGLPLGPASFLDCYLDVVEEKYTLEEYLKTKEKENIATWKNKEH